MWVWVSKACKVCGCRRLVGCVCRRLVGCLWKACRVSVGVKGL